MILSYWEQKTWFSNVDFTVVGGGIVGLTCALNLKLQHPKAKILVLERGIMPQGASTKNAGFACFGSLSELLSDLESHSEQEVFQLVNERFNGLQLLRETLGDKAINYQAFGGYELFTDQDLFERCQDETDRINTILKPLFNAEVFSFVSNSFNFKGVVPELALNTFEAQLDTGQMMQALIHKVQALGVLLLQGIELVKYEELNDKVSMQTSVCTFNTGKLFVATNGFSSQLLKEDLLPARAQVFITKPIKDLAIRGTFHLEHGYYYFRNIDNRILLGGGRNLDIQAETTTEFGQTERIQNKLEDLLRTVILPDTAFSIDLRWSGIMGVGKQKKALVKPISANVFCGIRLGGMGVAIGSSIGKKLAQFAN